MNDITSFNSFYDRQTRKIQEFVEEVSLQWYSTLGTNLDILQWVDKPN